MSEAPKTSAASGDSASPTAAAASAASVDSTTPAVPLKPASGDPAASEALKVPTAADAEPALPHNIRCQVGRRKYRS